MTEVFGDLLLQQFIFYTGNLSWVGAVWDPNFSRWWLYMLYRKVTKILFWLKNNQWHLKIWTFVLHLSKYCSIIHFITFLSENIKSGELTCYMYMYSMHCRQQYLHSTLYNTYLDLSEERGGCSQDHQTMCSVLLQQILAADLRSEKDLFICEVSKGIDFHVPLL